MAQYGRHALDGMGEQLWELARSDTDEYDWSGWLGTPLRVAARRGDLKMVKTLLKAGAGLRDAAGEKVQRRYMLRRPEVRNCCTDPSRVPNVHFTRFPFKMRVLVHLAQSYGPNAS